MSNASIKPRILTIVGPTGTGKSELSLMLAEHLGNAQIVSMDSMQVYRGLDIGTAKLTMEERRGIPHHMLDVADPNEIYTVSAYKADAGKAIEDILSKGDLPILVGGTGLYLNALSYEMPLGGEGSDEAFRNELREIAKTESGKQALFERLKEIDPESAGKLHVNDIHRVIRALEIYHVTGKRKSEILTPQVEGPYTFRIIGLTDDRARLYERINARVLSMLDKGWMDEVAALMARGVRFDSPEGGVSQAIGYPELSQVLSGSLAYEQAVEWIQRNTRRYAKRQWTWFNRDPRVQWFSYETYGNREELYRAVLSAVKQNI